MQRTEKKKMMRAAARNAMGTAAASGIKKKPRKPYTISRLREKWTADEHERFLHSLLVFGRDWKTIEQFVGTKTATQIRSHAQKYFLKVHKLGLTAALPPPHPRRPAVLPLPPTSSGGGCFLEDDAAAAGSMALDCPTASCPASAAATPPNCGAGSPSEEEPWFADCDKDQLPLSPDDLRFAEVYRFVGDVFGSGAPRPIEEQLQRLHGADPLVAETILLVLSNLQDKLCDY